MIWGLAQKGQLTAAKWNPFLTESVWADYLLVGLWNTLRAAAVSIVTANVFGLLFGLGRLSHSRIVRGVCGTVVEFFRAVPVLIMMIFFWQLFSYVPGLERRATVLRRGLRPHAVQRLRHRGARAFRRAQPPARRAGGGPRPSGLTRSKSLRLVGGSAGSSCGTIGGMTSCPGATDRLGLRGAFDRRPSRAHQGHRREDRCGCAAQPHLSQGGIL
ncbi:ABC transporter permease subunit [Georgenia sp. SUBG003]|uniref:ABC transporter permease subunit n=1 Tax=Georgenia sp. SUBG003 TaxID=1497974 RepID=UPI003AB4FCE2